MHQKERRLRLQRPEALLKRELNDAQSFALTGLEGFGWELKFIRHPLFQDPLVVVFDAERGVYAVIERDGSLNERTPVALRH
jgi:hypothetical protein